MENIKYIDCLILWRLHLKKKTTTLMYVLYDDVQIDQ